MELRREIDRLEETLGITFGTLAVTPPQEVRDVANVKEFEVRTALSRVVERMEEIERREGRDVRSPQRSDFFLRSPEQE